MKRREGEEGEEETNLGARNLSPSSLKRTSHGTFPALKTGENGGGKEMEASRSERFIKVVRTGQA